MDKIRKQNESNGIRREMRGNLPTDVLADWNWDPNDPMDSLNGLRDACIDFGATIVNWYNSRKSQKQKWAKKLRATSIVIAGAGTLLLLWAQDPDLISPIWGSSTLIVAGTLVAIDRFFGYTRSWMRFVSTANRVRVQLRCFKLQWECKSCEWGENGPSKAQVAASISLANEFVAYVDKVVSDEIGEWVSEFESKLIQHNDSSDPDSGACHVVPASDQ